MSDPFCGEPDKPKFWLAVEYLKIDFDTGFHPVDKPTAVVHGIFSSLGRALEALRIREMYGDCVEYLVDEDGSVDVLLGSDPMATVHCLTLDKDDHLYF